MVESVKTAAKTKRLSIRTHPMMRLCESVSLRGCSEAMSRVEKDIYLNLQVIIFEQERSSETVAESRKSVGV